MLPFYYPQAYTHTRVSLVVVVVVFKQLLKA